MSRCDGEKSELVNDDKVNLKKYVLSLDVGTTNVRAKIYDEKARIVGKFTQKIKIQYGEPGAVEIDPDELWPQVEEVMKGALNDGNIDSSEIASMGISVQRGTFILVDKESGKPFHNFICWQDTRAEYIERDWNESYTMKVVKAGGKVAFGLSRQKRFLAAAVMNFRTNHMTIRLLWVLEKYSELRAKAKEGKVQLMMLETWLIWKLTSGKTYATEMSNASSTGIYDPFIQDWNSLFCHLMNIPMQIFPPVWKSNSNFGSCDQKFFGAEIPICAALGDQQSAMFGQCCFREGKVKLTIGTGTFLNMNIGPEPHASVEGFYPVTAWQRESEVVHLAEGASGTAGNAVAWLVDTFSMESPAHTQALADSVSDSNGVYFVPSFTGLQAPDNDFSACSSLMGLSSSVTKAHIARAVLEALAFRTAQVFQAMTSEVSIAMKRVVCDGGVSANDFVVQLIADLIDHPVERMEQLDMSALGVALMAGRTIGFWKSDENLSNLVKVEKVFQPNKGRAAAYAITVKQWKNALERSKKWYKK